WLSCSSFTAVELMSTPMSAGFLGVKSPTVFPLCPGHQRPVFRPMCARIRTKKQCPRNGLPQLSHVFPVMAPTFGTPSRPAVTETSFWRLRMILWPLGRGIHRCAHQGPGQGGMACALYTLAGFDTGHPQHMHIFKRL